MVLTWRNVDAPDFTPSMRGYETFSRLLENAFGGAQQGLDRYDRKLDQNYNNNIMLQFAGIQDPEQAKLALGELNGLGGNDRLTGATINQLSGRPNELFTQALNQENLGWTSYQHDRTRGFDSAEDKTAALMPQYLIANAAGKGDEFLKANPDFGGGMSLAGRSQLFTQGQGAREGSLRIEGQGITNEGGRISNRTGEFNLGRNEWQFGNEKLTFEEGRQADGFVATFLGTGHTIDDLDGNPEFSKLSPQVQYAVRQRFGANGAGGSAPGSSGGGGGAPGGGDPTRVMNYQAREKGFAAIPDNVRTFGQASDFAITVNRAGAPSSAMGLYQITGETMRDFGPRVFGPNWRDVDLTPENQDRLGRAIFESTKGDPGALRSRWTSLDAATAARVSKLPWEQARNVIAQGESGGNPASILTGQRLGDQGNRNQFMQQNANSVAEPIQQAMTDTSSLTATVTRITGDKGPLAGLPRGVVTTRIQEIQTEAKARGVQLSPAAAAVILERVMVPNDAIFFTGPGMFNGDAINGDYKVDRKAQTGMIDSIASGDYQRQAVTNQGLGDRTAAVDGAYTSWQQSKRNLDQAEARAARNPNFDRSILGRLRIDEADKREKWSQAVRVSGGASAQGGYMGNSFAPPPAARPVAQGRPIQRQSTPQRTMPPFLPGQGPVNPANGWFMPGQPAPQTAAPWWVPAVGPRR